MNPTVENKDHSGNSKTRIGLVSPYWPPKFGGAEQYLYRMVQKLNALDFDVKVITATGEKKDRDNGVGDVTRFTPNGDMVSHALYPLSGERAELEGIANHFAFFDAVVAWVRQHDLKVVIIGNPFQQKQYIHARELFKRLKDMNVKVGIAHHDMPGRLEKFLQALYLDMRRGWDVVEAEAMKQLTAAARTGSRMAAYLELASPLVLEPDFLISNSAWVHKFVDPLGEVPNYVFYPTMDADHWGSLPAGEEKMKYRDVLMVNPQLRKGPKIMAELIASAKPNWTFRVTKGGWGNSFKTFLPTINSTKAMQSGRVECLDYVKDMRFAFEATGVMFFPSLVEGYGMAAIEPMFMGTPVVSSNYPAVVEAVGDGAYLLCPYTASPQQWFRAVEEVFENRDHWRQKSLARARQHAARQDVQIGELCDFLRSIHASATKV